MDDFYKECQEKIQNAVDTAIVVDELIAISLHDLPKVQMCKFAEQAVTLISTLFQSSVYPTQELIIRFQAIRQQLNATLSYMEEVMKAEIAYPPINPQENGFWW